MANVRFGAGVVEMRGSIAGTKFSRNRSGAYASARVTPVNPSTGLQENVRAIMSSLSEQWHESPMTDAFRIAWGVYASSVNAVNKLGESIAWTGFNAFMAGNSIKLLNGYSYVPDGPVALGLPNQDPVASIVLSEASGITITFDDGLDWCDEDNACMSILLGKPQSPSRNYFGGPYRYHGQIAGDSVTAPTSPEGPTAVTAWTLLEGQKMWAELRILREDGRVSGAFHPAPVLIGA